MSSRIEFCKKCQKLAEFSAKGRYCKTCAVKVTQECRERHKNGQPPQKRGRKPKDITPLKDVQVPKDYEKFSSVMNKLINSFDKNLTFTQLAAKMSSEIVTELAKHLAGDTDSESSDSEDAAAAPPAAETQQTAPQVAVEIPPAPAEIPPVAAEIDQSVPVVAAKLDEDLKLTAKSVPPPQAAKSIPGNGFRIGELKNRQFVVEPKNNVRTESEFVKFVEEQKLKETIRMYIDNKVADSIELVGEPYLLTDHVMVIDKADKSYIIDRYNELRGTTSLPITKELLCDLLKKGSKLEKHEGYVRKTVDGKLKA